MTPERWMSLSYPEQKKALVEAVCDEEEWDWADEEVWQAFFEVSEEPERGLRRFVDIRRLRTFFGSRELDDFDADMGMDSYQYRNFSDSLFGNLNRSLYESNESFELAILDAIGATFVTKQTTYIRARDVHGGFLVLKFTRNVYTDGRDDEVIGPFESDDEHDLIDHTGEWVEVGAGCLYDDQLTDTPDESEDGEQVLDLPDVPEVDKDMELRLTMGYGEDDEMSIPGYDEDTDSPERGLGDALYE